MNKELTERFLKYVSFDTQSSEENEAQCPSTEKQMVLAAYLCDELKAIGMTEVEMDEHGYVYASLPANSDKQVPTIGFIAHMDTSPDCSGKDIKPRIIENYDGSDIVLCQEDNIVTTVSQFPELKQHSSRNKARQDTGRLQSRRRNRSRRSSLRCREVWLCLGLHDGRQRGGRTGV